MEYSPPVPFQVRLTLPALKRGGFLRFRNPKYPVSTARYSIFKIKSLQLASEIDRFNPFFFDCPII